MKEQKKEVKKIGARNWFVIVLLGLAGQLAWNVENSWFNTFVYDTLTKDPKPIAWMVAISAVTATLTTIFMGAYSDRIGKRKNFRSNNNSASFSHDNRCWSFRNDH